MSALREAPRRVKVEMVRKTITRSPYLSDRRISEICGVSDTMVTAIRGRELGLGGVRFPGSHGDDVIMFSKEEMVRLDNWLRENGLLKGVEDD